MRTEIHLPERRRRPSGPPAAASPVLVLLIGTTAIVVPADADCVLQDDEHLRRCFHRVTPTDHLIQLRWVASRRLSVSSTPWRHACCHTRLELYGLPPRACLHMRRAQLECRPPRSCLPWRARQNRRGRSSRHCHCWQGKASSVTASDIHRRRRFKFSWITVGREAGDTYSSTRGRASCPERAAELLVQPYM